MSAYRIAIEIFMYIKLKKNKLIRGEHVLACFLHTQHDDSIDGIYNSSFTFDKDNLDDLLDSIEIGINALFKLHENKL